MGTRQPADFQRQMVLVLPWDWRLQRAGLPHQSQGLLFHGGDGEIVTVALAQVGNVGGAPYWSWYGFDSRVEWCACFVSRCGAQCGYIDAGVIPKFAACASQGVPWFQERI